METSIGAGAGHVKMFYNFSHRSLNMKVDKAGMEFVIVFHHAEGFGRLYTFMCNLNSKKLCHIYNKALLPSAKKMFGPAPDDWVLQEDNDPKHTSKLAKA
eukprot:m51a1_g8022 hypothetical protein (100) ;mRNA; r:1618-2674